jgi:hypothetical protein
MTKINLPLKNTKPLFYFLARYLDIPNQISKKAKAEKLKSRQNSKYNYHEKNYPFSC